MKPVAAVVLLAACSLPDEGLQMGDDEAAALSAVWDDVYGASDVSPPRVEWWFDDCPGTERTAVVLDGTCYSGYFRPGRWKADVAWRGSFSRSAYAHELMHAWQYARGIDDPDHLLPEWAKVDEANERLRDRGM